MDNDDSSIAKPERDDIEALIERWWAEHFSGAAVAQVKQAWNQALAAKEELKRLLQNVTSATAKE